MLRNVEKALVLFEISITCDRRACMHIADAYWLAGQQNSVPVLLRERLPMPNTPKPQTVTNPSV